MPYDVSAVRNTKSDDATITLESASLFATKTELDDLKTELDRCCGKGINALILGDSYSQIGAWVDALSAMVDFKELVNLGSSSGHLKDNYGDLNLYPHCDRPFQKHCRCKQSIWKPKLLLLPSIMVTKVGKWWRTIKGHFRNILN